VPITSLRRDHPPGELAIGAGKINDNQIAKHERPSRPTGLTNGNAEAFITGWMELAGPIIKDKRLPLTVSGTVQQTEWGLLIIAAIQLYAFSIEATDLILPAPHRKRIEHRTSAGRYI